jgi:hypothetical protein
MSTSKKKEIKILSYNMQKFLLKIHQKQSKPEAKAYGAL